MVVLVLVVVDSSSLSDGDGDGGDDDECPELYIPTANSSLANVYNFLEIRVLKYQLIFLNR